MRIALWLIHCSVILPLLAAYLVGSSFAAQASTLGRITVLYDSFGQSSEMDKGWGYAALVEYGGRRILFHTGNNADVLQRNVKAKGADLSKLDFVVMSHRHGDHMG